MFAIKSMTGYAVAEKDFQSGHLEISLRSVNGRFADLVMSVPDGMQELEGDIRKNVSGYIFRGKAELTISVTARDSGQLNVNRGLLDELCALAEQIRAKIPDSAINIPDLFMVPGVMTAPAPEISDIDSEVMSLLDDVLQKHDRMRRTEGEALRRVLSDGLMRIEDRLKLVEEHLAGLVADERQRILERIKSLAIEVDAERINQEVALAAQKSDITEEHDRMRTHIAAVRQVLENPEKTNGKRLDFLIQELMREANTIASKASRHDVSAAAVDLKVMIEQLREQVQNIE